MHHKFSDDRMIIIRWENDKTRWKWNIHEVKTEISEIEYDEINKLEREESNCYIFSLTINGTYYLELNSKTTFS